VQIRVYGDRLKIWNAAVLAEGWGLDDLLREHASLPYNPNVANAFFRAGEIEAWGRGIQRIFQACKDAGAPPPQLQLSGHDLWLDFPFAAEYVQQINQAGSDQTGAEALDKTSVKTSVKTPTVLLALLRRKPEMTLAQAAVEIGLSVRAIELASAKLVAAGKLRYVGPQRGGRWEVMS
jgi:ATP-dependent DNA helicase RecG